MKGIATNKERRSKFVSGAKEFFAANAEGLKSQDNDGMKSQLKADKSFLKHANLIGLGLLGRDRYPDVIADDIGGGFGSKGSIAREDIALIAAAGELGRSVRWIEDRVENLMDGGQAREEDLTVSIAVDNDGTFRGLRVDLVVDQGAYPGFPVGAPTATRMMKVMFPGSYHWDAFEMRTRIVATNKGKYVAYRGPWANETWARERMIDIVAGALRDVAGGRSPQEHDRRGSDADRDDHGPDDRRDDVDQEDARTGARTARHRTVRTRPRGGARRQPLPRPGHRAATTRPPRDRPGTGTS